MSEAEAAPDERPALKITDLFKDYSKSVRALNGVSLSVSRGEIFGLLGPNGAGKSTLVKIALTLTRQTSGEVLVMGVDTARDQARARRLIGYVPQQVSVDGDLSGYENLLVFSKLYMVDRGERKARIEDALKTMGLQRRRNDLASRYSGGMMRRLEIAQAVVNRPKVLFLDEPTIGLDPSGKREVWGLIKRLRDDYEATVLITTHDMTEAEALCDRVAIINEGTVVAVGTPAELKGLVGGEVVTVRLKEEMGEAASRVRFPAELEASVLGSASGPGGPSDGREVSIVVKIRAEEAALRVAKAFEAAGLEVESLSFSGPTLDDVFLKFTNARIHDVESLGGSGTGRRQNAGA